MATWTQNSLQVKWRSVILFTWNHELVQDSILYLRCYLMHFSVVSILSSGIQSVPVAQILTLYTVPTITKGQTELVGKDISQAASTATRFQGSVILVVAQVSEFEYWVQNQLSPPTWVPTLNFTDLEWGVCAQWVELFHCKPLLSATLQWIRILRINRMAELNVHLSVYLDITSTHVTLNESDASESITWRSIKSVIAHFSVPYLDNAHFSKINGCFGSVNCTK